MADRSDEQAGADTVPVHGIVIQHHANGCEVAGCKFYGAVLEVDYQKHWESNPRYGQFNSQSVYDSIDAAKSEVRRLHGDFNVLLSMPTLVVRLAG